MRSHHKGHYTIQNGSDTEPGGVRRGRRRNPPKAQKSLLSKAADYAKGLAKDAIEEAAKEAASRLKKAAQKAARADKLKSGGLKSHKKGEYPIRNGSDKESGGVRRGPRRSVSQNDELNKKREKWRAAKAGKGK